MLDANKRMNQTHPSLLPLRMALIAAERVSPARPPRIDANEQRAIQLIQKMRTEHQKPAWKEESIFNSFKLQEVVGSDV
jgi:hypothetical protein